MKYFTLCITLTTIVAFTFLVELEAKEIIFVSYMRTRNMEDSQAYYNHGEEVIGLHVSMGNTNTKSNGCRGRVVLLELDENIRILQKEV